MDEKEISDAAIKELCEELKPLWPAFKKMSDEQLAEVWRCQTEDPGRRLIVKLESLRRYGFGRDDHIH